MDLDCVLVFTFKLAIFRVPLGESSKGLSRLENEYAQVCRRSPPEELLSHLFGRVLVQLGLDVYAFFPIEAHLKMKCQSSEVSEPCRKSLENFLGLSQRPVSRCLF